MNTKYSFGHYLTPGEEKKLFAHMGKLDSLDAQRDLGWMVFMRYTGIRVNAMSLFTCGDARLSIERGEVTLRGETQKRGRKHALHLHSKARESLLKLLSIRQKMGGLESPDDALVISRLGRGLKSPDDALVISRLGRGLKSPDDALDISRLGRGMTVPDDALDISRIGRGMTVRNFQYRMRHHAQAAGLHMADHISPHWLRHTLAKRLMASSTARDARAIVQGVLGHASYSTTAIYTAPDRETLAHELEAYA